MVRINACDIEPLPVPTMTKNYIVCHANSITNKLTFTSRSITNKLVSDLIVCKVP